MDLIIKENKKILYKARTQGTYDMVWLLTILLIGIAFAFILPYANKNTSIGQNPVLVLLILIIIIIIGIQLTRKLFKKKKTEILFDLSKDKNLTFNYEIEDFYRHRTTIYIEVKGTDIDFVLNVEDFDELKTKLSNKINFVKKDVLG